MTLAVLYPRGRPACPSRPLRQWFHRFPPMMMYVGSSIGDGELVGAEPH